MASIVLEGVHFRRKVDLVRVVIPLLISALMIGVSLGYAWARAVYTVNLWR